VSITHTEVRRHPLWKEQAAADSDTNVRRSPRVRLVLIGVGALVLIGALLFMLLR
jgi:hypothetical protein